MKKILLLLLLFAPLVAEEESNTQTPALEQVEPIPEAPLIPTTVYRKQFLATLVAILVILIVIFLVIWLLRRFTPTRIYQSNQKKNIKVLERRHLSPNTFLYHIQVGDQQFIIAESKFHIRTVATIDWEDDNKSS